MLINGAEIGKWELYGPKLHLAHPQIKCSPISETGVQGIHFPSIESSASKSKSKLIIEIQANVFGFVIDFEHCASITYKSQTNRFA